MIWREQMNEHRKTSLMNQIAEQAVSDTLDLWPEIQARVGVKTGRRPADATSTAAGGIWTRRPLIGLATVAVLVLVVGVTSPQWNHPDAASAQAILDRAQATASGAPLAVTTYHLRMTRQVPGKENATITTEVWFAGSTRQRSESEVKAPNGTTLSTNGVIFDGSQTWIHQVENGQTRVIHTVGTTWNSPVDDPSKQTSLADVLTRYGNDKQCQDARQQGEATVANWPTYVIVVTPRSANCGSDAGPNAKSPAAAVKRVEMAQSGATDTSVGQMTVWVDEQSFLPLRTEVRNPAGTVLDESQVTDLQYNVAIPDATFTYTPPAGVSVYNFTGGDGAQVKEAIFTGKATPTK
jgi:outer membrane lipoprotein-sorting protein